MDREYCICYKGKNGMDEIGLNAAVLQEAKNKAMWYIKNKVALEDITIKLYEDGDLKHQFDYKDNKWVQYE